MLLCRLICRVFIHVVACDERKSTSCCSYDSFYPLQDCYLDSVPVVYYGLLQHALILKSHGKTTTYNASKMCAFPASSIGFRNPGYIHDVLLRILLPNTLYYYQFGSGMVSF